VTAVGLLDGEFVDGSEVGIKANVLWIDGTNDGSEEGSSLSSNNSNSFNNFE
jgi:hypothetical protein